MIKTTYQTPELRNANDEVIQEGAFGKNTALSNSTNDGWIDYVVNNLEALHDTIGDSAPTLDGNGHVVEPANLAIGDEDGNRIKNSYLKLTGGKVTGVASFRTDLRMLDNQDNRWGGLYVPGTTSSVQYLSLYGGTRATGDARLNLYNVGNGKFELTGYSADGANAYTLTHDNSGNLKWRGTNIALANAFLPLSGGTMTGNIGGNVNSFRIYSAYTDNSGNITIYGGANSANTGALFQLHGKNSSGGAGFFNLTADDGTDSKQLQGRPNGILTWDGQPILYGQNRSYGNNGYSIIQNINTVIQWRRVSISASAATTWTYTIPFASNDYMRYVTATNNYSFTTTATTMTVTNTGSSSAEIDMLAIGLMAQ